MHARNPYKARAAPTISFLLLTGLLVAGCGDAPTEVRPDAAHLFDPQAEAPNASGLMTDPLDRVAQLMGDEFVRPLTVYAVGQFAADQLTFALEPEVEVRDELDRGFSDPVAALLNIRDQLRSDARSLETDPPRTDAADDTSDPDSLIIEDALELVVDDALDELLTAADTSTGG